MESFLHNSTTFYHKTIDLFGNYVYFNNFYLSNFNFSGTVKKGKKCLNLVFNDDVIIVEDCMQKLLSKEFNTCRINIRKKISKTKFIWTEWEYSTILNNKNEIIGFNCVGFKKINSQDETLFFQDRTDGINGVITELLIDENLNFNWEFLSDGIENLYEITLKQARENPNIIYDLIDKEDFENSKTVFLNAIKNTTPYFIQHRITTPSGKRKWIEVSSIPKKQKNNSTIWLGFHKDVTHKKTLEIANKSNELLLKKLAEDINGGLAQLKMYENKKFECTYMSEGTEKFSELSFEEVQQNPEILFNIIHPDDREKVINTIFNAFKTLTPYRNQYRIVTKSGNLKWLNVNASPKQQLDGSVVFNAFYEDITIQKLQEFENIKNQNLILNLTNNLKCVVYQFKMTTENEFIFEFIGGNLKSLFEVDFTAVKKDPFLLHKMILDEDLQMVLNQSDTAFKTVTQFSSQHRIKVPSGKIKWIDVHAVPQKRPDGTIVFYGFFNDITAIKMLEFENLKSQEQLKNLTNNIKGALTQFKIGANLKISWEYLSKGVEEIYEMDFDFIKKNPKKFESLIDSFHLKNIKNEFKKAISTKSAFTYQHQITTPSGKRKWVEINSHPIENQDKSITWYGFDIDITDKKEIELENKKSIDLISNLTNNINGLIAQIRFKDSKTLIWEFVSKGIENLYEVDASFVYKNPNGLRKMIVKNKLTEISNLLELSYKNNIPLNYEHQIKTPSGKIKWIKVNAVPTKQLNGDVLWHSFHEDISEKKEIEFENLKVQEQLKNLTDNLDGALSQLRVFNDGTIKWEYMSTKIENIYEFSFQDAQKNPFLIRDMVSKDTVILMKQEFEKSTTKLIPYQTQIQIITKSGAYKWVQVNALPQKQADNTILMHGYHRDITSLKKLELEAQIAKQKIYETADFITNLTNNIDGMLTQARVYENNNFEMEFVSKGIEYIYEITAEEFENDKFALQKTLLPEYDALVTQTMNNANETQLPINMVYQIKTKTGKQKWVEVNSYPKKTNDNCVVWYGFHLDVTDKKNLEIAQKKSELKIVESERFLKNITNNLQGMLTTARIDSLEAYHLEYVSKGIEALYEITFKEFKKDNKKLLNQIHEKDLKSTQNQMDYAIKNTTPMFLQYRIVTPSGKTKWIEVSSYPQKQVDGSVIWYGFHSDITQTKKLEIDNLINEEKLKFIVDNAPSAIIMFENNQVSFISSNYKKIFGFSVEEETNRLNTQFWDILSDDEDKLNIKKQLQHAVKSQKNQLTIKYKYRHKNGNLIWRKDEISFFYDTQGRVSKAVELVSDITDKKNLENLVLNQNLQLALQIEENEKISENFLAFQSDKWLEISQNLHDNISQLLFAANLHLNNFNSKDQSLKKANGLIKMALDEIKFVTQSTKNLVIQNKGFENALSELIDNNNFLKNISITKKINSEFHKRFSKSEQMILFTIIQEAIQNAIKHSEGSSIKIVLDIKNAHYFLSIKDDGVGLKQNFENGMGVYNIEKNVNLLNGNIQYINKNGLELLINFL